MDFVPFDSQRFNQIRSEILASYQTEEGINHISSKNLPSQAEVTDIVAGILHLLFPGFYDGASICQGNVDSKGSYCLDHVHQTLSQQIVRCIFAGRTGQEMRLIREQAISLSLDVLGEIPRLRRLLWQDVLAAYEGDPAASSPEEVIVAYPSVMAVALYRFAHELYERRIPLLPRIVSEYAHMRTGIDIHPGASIGERFFIDHGTGVVVGETCKIGRAVKIYQMVTLGALSFPRHEDGRLVKGREIKRHPTIEDNVVLYAGCTILGGDTVIGEGSVIGGNVWLTRSVPAGSVIIFDADKADYRRFTKLRSLLTTPP